MTSSTSNVWTTARVETLERGFRAGLSDSQIAVEIGGGVTRNMVNGKRQRLALRHEDPALARSLAAKAQAREVRARLLMAAPQPKRSVMVETPPNDEGKPFRLLERHECRWPLNPPFQPVTADTPFCGAPRVNAYDDGLHGHYCRRHQVMSKRGAA